VCGDYCARSDAERKEEGWR